MLFQYATITLFSMLAELQRMGFALSQIEVIFRHDAEQLLKTYLQLPVQSIACLVVIAEPEIGIVQI